jgi:adenylate cyclase
LDQSTLNDTRSSRGALDQRLRTARLASGLVLMTFVVLHFLNHMLALISLQAAEAGRLWFLLIWRNPAGTLLLAAALLVHVGLTLRALYLRRTLVMPLREAVQVVMGLVIPVLIAEHVAGTRIYSALSGVQDTYEFVANSLWVSLPGAGARQVVAVIAVWVHGCLGLFFWLRYRKWFPRVAPLLLVVATLFPVLTLLGFVNAGRAVADIRFAGADHIDPAVIDAAMVAKSRAVSAIYSVYGGILGIVVLLRFARSSRERRNLVEIRYPHGRAIRVPKGYSVLEASRLAGIPHHSVCGGRGRCSTCRVRVLEHLDRLPPAVGVERLTLERIHAEPDIRLACQLRPVVDIKVSPLLAAGSSALGVTGQAVAAGHEHEVAVLFCDIRSFTALADRRLPFDTVFLLNRYFSVVGKAVERAGGRLDKFIGDGAMAIFGLETSRDEACRQAIAAASYILDDLARVSEELAAELPSPLRIAIGIHAGPAIAGSMGYGRVMNVTVIGDTVNVASRLESVAKELDASVVVSASAVKLSGIDLSHYETRTVDIRGRSRPLRVFVVPQDSRLAIEMVAAAE